MERANLVAASLNSFGPAQVPLGFRTVHARRPPDQVRILRHPGMLSARNVPSTTTELIPVLVQTNAQAYCQLAASILIVYEHLALLEQEIEYMWHWKTTSITVLFLANRSILYNLTLSSRYIVEVIMSCLDLFDLSECHHCLSCEWLFELQYALTIILVFIIALFSTLRVYAVSCRRRWPGVLTLATAVVAIPVQLFGDIRSSRAYVTYIGHIPICTKSTFFSDALNTQ
ncbi:hypothetical protein DAEQUDRAFT_384034 [Daedalea quercina L-15889]|uniref:DUF6533 domain-containing protein n=1 Tax=Daedalea quercina L-15889 TaxID=1314783 RepID=A0A165P137_9APHY|nr:hypothetical protein DAEQUDRAFT_384034 [Daedalea quercina L-15889]